MRPFNMPNSDSLKEFFTIYKLHSVPVESLTNHCHQRVDEYMSLLINH